MGLCVSLYLRITELTSSGNEFVARVIVETIQSETNSQQMADLRFELIMHTR